MDVSIRIPGPVKIVRSFGLRLRGLMFRLRWPQEWAGLHFPCCSSVHTSFCFFRFDLLFLDADGRITRMVVDATPWRIYRGPSGTINTLETQAGTIRSLGIQAGDQVIWKDTTHKRF